MNLSRREFVRKTMQASAAAGFASFLPCLSWPLDTKPQDASLVVLSRRQKLKRSHDDIDKAVAREFLDRALPALTGHPDPLSAWKSLFREGEKVAIKLSCVPGISLSSSRGLVQAIVDSLVATGISLSCIIIWDRTTRELKRAGFDASTSSAKVTGTDAYPGWGYSDQLEISGSVGACFSQIMEEADALINVPLLKDHDISGVSIGMKNFYGAIHNPNKFHANHGDPFIADLCRHPLIRSKLRLTVCDASRVQTHNGPAFFPSYATEYGCLLASRDPVALDQCGWEIIEELRKIQKLPSLKEEGREPAYIRTAARLGLGFADPVRIRKIQI